MSNWVNNLLFEERVYATSAFSTVSGPDLVRIIRNYREEFPNDPAGNNFNKNMNITEWDE